MNKFYIYAIFDPRKEGEYIYEDYIFKYQPIYIGKGKGNRKDFHLYESKLKSETNLLKKNILKKIINLGKVPIIEILKDNLNEKESFILEKKLINIIGRRDLNKGSLVNLTDGGEGQSGSTLFQSENNPFYGKKHLEESFKKVYKPVIQYSKNGVYINTFKSLSEAATKTNSISSKISDCCKGKRKSHNNFLWEFLNEEDINSNKKVSKKTNYKSIIQRDLNGKIIRKWDKISHILKKNNIHKSNLIDCLKGRKNTCNGFNWEYEL
jgi:hypothetical protein